MEYFRIYLNKLKNNWEVWHDVSWTSFEIKSAILGILRKNLYPDGYLVRGEYQFVTNKGKKYSPPISIFKRIMGKPATLKLIILLDEDLKEQIENDLQVPVVIVSSQEEIFTLLDTIKQMI